MGWGKRGGGGWWVGGGGAGGGRAGRGFLLHWGGAKTKGLFFVLARRCRPLADMSPARVGFNAPSSKNSRLIFAQQPRPNGKRNPLLHVLRTAGTLPMIKLGPCCNREGVAGASVRHRRGGRRAKRNAGGGRGKAASSKNPVVILAWEPGKIQTKASAPRPADGGRRRWKGFRVRGSGRAPKGWQGGEAGAGVVQGTATRTDTDKHGRTRTDMDG
jgi:hypothetical protein